MFCKDGVLRNFAKFIGKHLCQSLFFNGVAGLFFHRTPLVGASIKNQVYLIGLSQGMNWCQTSSFRSRALCIHRSFFNYPAQKSSNQFCNGEMTSNFDIAARRIHVERFLCCVRDWSILNSVRPIQRRDVWQFLSQIVNIVEHQSPPIVLKVE